MFVMFFLLLSAFIAVNATAVEPPEIVVLDHHGHSLKRLEEEQFASHNKTTHLILSNCSLTSIHRRAFCGLPLLRILDLSDNQLQYIDRDTFNCTPSLRNLYLTNNIKLGAGVSGEFPHSNSIKYLDIKNCGFNSFSSHAFASMKSLRTIIASNNSACPELRRSRRKVKIVHCEEGDNDDQITDVPPSSEIHFPDNVSELKIQNFSTTIVPKRFLHNYNFTNLNILHMAGLNITSIHPSAFCGLDSLFSINLSSNDIQFLHPETFDCLPNLQNLSLANNPRLGYGSHRTFLYSHSVQHLDISNCNFASYFDEMFSSLRHLKFINATGNTICPKMLEELEHVKHVPCTDEDVEGGNNEETPAVFSNTFFSGHRWRNVTRLDLSNRSLSVIYPHTFCALPHLLELDLSNNKIEYLNPNMFECTPKLRYLYLTSNVKLNPDQNEVFLRSASIRHLDIENCNFTSFTDTMFSELDNLLFLNAVGNPSCSQTTLHLRDISNVPCTDVFDYEVNAYELPAKRQVLIKGVVDISAPQEMAQQHEQKTLGGPVWGLWIVFGSMNIALVAVFGWVVKRRVTHHGSSMEKPLLAIT